MKTVTLALMCDISDVILGYDLNFEQVWSAYTWN